MRAMRAMPAQHVCVCVRVCVCAYSNRAQFVFRCVVYWETCVRLCLRAYTPQKVILIDRIGPPLFYTEIRTTANI